MTELTHGRLRELLDYNPETGVLTWRVARGPRKAGAVAGSESLGYLHVMIDGRNYKAHRLAWFWVHGEWPKDEIDHRAGDTADNRLSELRNATSSQNKMNRRTGTNNTSGLKGAFLDKRDGRWYARVTIGGQHKHLGRFDTAEEAHAAYVVAAREAYGEFACQTL
jgi:hypothetical protein